VLGTWFRLGAFLAAVGAQDAHRELGWAVRASSSLGALRPGAVARSFAPMATRGERVESASTLRLEASQLFIGLLQRGARRGRRIRENRRSKPPHYRRLSPARPPNLGIRTPGTRRSGALPMSCTRQRLPRVSSSPTCKVILPIRSGNSRPSAIRSAVGRSYVPRGTKSLRRTGDARRLSQPCPSLAPGPWRV
jgi:hypothetical protein